MKKQEFEDYYLGFDIGTNSIGWAVTNLLYQVLRFNKKSMWGVLKFDEAKTAESRRLSRTSRRRLDRRKDRLNFLQNVFEEEINKIDPDFFTRLDESSLYQEDKTINEKNVYFIEPDYNDSHYFKEYPTIYHLRHALMNEDRKFDIRHVYLALHHILKYRGHFLYEGTFSEDSSLETIINNINQISENLFNHILFEVSHMDFEDFKEIMKNQAFSKSDKKKSLHKYLYQLDLSKEEVKAGKQLVNLLVSGKVDFRKIFLEHDEEEKFELNFDKENFEEELEEFTLLSDLQRDFILSIKSLHDWAILENMRRGKKNISEAKISDYKEHQKDLRKLKEVVRASLPDEYYDIFTNLNGGDNYPAYIGQGDKKVNREKFYDYVKKILKKINGNEKFIEEVSKKIENDSYLLKQRNNLNGVIPHQLHETELKLILANAEKHYSFLSEKDETGLSYSEKILAMFKFRIPYYIGPLNDYHKDKENGFAWVVRKEKGKVYPWNFEEKIDVEQTAELFIRKMTNKCTYLLDKDVLPKNSLLYQKYIVLNEINKLKINSHPISVELKQKLFQDLYINKNQNITKKRIIA